MNASKKQGEVSVHSLKAFRRKSGIVPIILDIGSKWRWVARFMPWLPHCQERTLVPIERDDRWAPEMVWALWGIDKFLAPASSLVATLTVSWLPRSKVLHRISYFTSIVNSSHLLCWWFFFQLWYLVEVGCNTDISEILAVSKEKWVPGGLCLYLRCMSIICVSNTSL